TEFVNDIFTHRGGGAAAFRRCPTWLRKMARNRARGSDAMDDAKSRLILVLIMSGLMVAIVTLLLTWLNLGLRSDFVWQWLRAYLIAWPVAAAIGFLVMPTARRLTARIVGGTGARH